MNNNGNGVHPTNCAVNSYTSTSLENNILCFFSFSGGSYFLEVINSLFQLRNN